MAGKTAEPYKATLSGSIGAGMGSVFNPRGRKYYILEHKVSSKYHRAGEAQEIIVDQIEIGRDSRCQVRFDDNFSTVSRRHAAIIKDGDNWKLVQISKTNTTLLNGRPVQNEWYLQNGDEIQLSVNGPKLGFIVPTGKKATVGSIGLTRRLSLFRQQALRPYKQAIAALAIVLVLTIGGLGTWNYLLRDDLDKQSKILVQQIEANKNNKEKADSLSKELVANNKKMKDYEERIEKMKGAVAAANSRASAAWRKASQGDISTGNGPGALKECALKTYYCELIISIEGKPVQASSGTGFLLSDGKFVTAQHVVNPLLYPDVTNEQSCILNALMHQSPESFTCEFIAVSPGGDRFSRKYTPNHNPFHMGSYAMETVGTIEFQGMNMPVIRAKNYACDFRDYAWVSTGKSGGLPFESALSKSMPIKTHLDILGFPMGVGAENSTSLSPIYSESSVAREGLDTDGCILLANSETDHGNSGGPVFATKDGKYVVVGILSGANRLGSKDGRGAGKWKDRVVPIANVH